MSFPRSSVLTGGPLLAGRSSGASTFPKPISGRVAGARLALHCNLATLPLSLLTAFVRHSDDHEGWGRLLRFLSPITTATGPPS